MLDLGKDFLNCSCVGIIRVDGDMALWLCRVGNDRLEWVGPGNRPLGIVTPIGTKGQADAEVEALYQLIKRYGHMEGAALLDAISAGASGELSEAGR